MINTPAPPSAPTVQAPGGTNPGNRQTPPPTPPGQVSGSTDTAAETPLLNRHGWEQVPGGGTTDTALAPVVNFGALFLFSRGIDDNSAYINWGAIGDN